MSTNTDLIKEFIACWSKLDASQLAGYFTDDGCYHNMPARPVKGRDNVEQFIKGFLSNWTETTWDIISIAENDGTVFCERLDRTRTKAGNVDLPCVGVFEMEGGKIKVWRDYFDMNTFVKAMS
ncbi:MAG: nuclear transport factor 2 family protein [Proteobacteria bacterium]|nr:nuclear transport factor 2 family protein [Pseudomonadota bacterium]